MLFGRGWQNGFNMSPAGTSADATDDGELTDEEVLSNAQSDDDAALLETEEQPEEETAEQPTKEEIKSLLEYGLPTEDPEELSRQFKANKERAERLEAWLYQQQLVEQQKAQQEFARQQKAEQEKQAQRPKSPWAIPEFDPNLKKFLRRDSEGNITVIPGGDPTLPQKYQEWLDAQERATQQFLSDPYTPLQEGLQPFINEQAQRIVQQEMAKYQQSLVAQQRQAALQQYENTYREVYFEKDGRTLNQAGLQFNKFYQEAEQYRLPDPLQYAHDKMDAIYGRILMDERNKPTDTQKKTAFLKNAAKRTPNRGGSIGKDKRGLPQNSKKLWDGALKALKDLPEEDFQEDDDK